MLCLFHFFQFIIIAFVATKQLCRSAIRTNTSCGVRNVAYHMPVALVLSFLGPPWCQWCSDWCAPGCSAAVAFGCVCFSHDSAWLRLVQVFVVAHLECLAFCRVGSGDTLCPVRLQRWGASRLLHRGIRPQAAAASCAHISCSGGWEPIAPVQMHLTRNRHFLVFVK